MKTGFWVPMNKSFVKFLPKDRPYTKLEACFSLQIDYDNDNYVSVAGYSTLWKWSQNKVRNFFKTIGIKIEYPENTGKKQNQKGVIKVMIRERYDFEKGEIRFIDNKELQGQKERCENEKKQIKERSRQYTGKTKKLTIIKPEKKEKKTPPPMELPSWLNQKSWDEYKQHRKELKKPLTPLAEKKALNKLKLLMDEGSPQEDVIDQAIERGWQGLFPVKIQAKPKTTTKKYVDLFSHMRKKQNGG